MLPFILLQLLGAILFFRLAPVIFLPLVTRLFGLLFARKSLTELQHESNLAELRTELKAIHMVDQFAKYAKIERRIKKEEQDISKFRSSRTKRMVVMEIGLKVLLKLIELGVTVWITWTARWEPVHLLPHDWLKVLPEYLRYEALVSPPGLLFLPLWIAACHFTIRRIVPLFTISE